LKRILFISYYFSPSGESGMQRSLKFVKYLPTYGWEPVVMTIKDNRYNTGRMDYASLKEIPDMVRIYRTGMIHLLSTLSRISHNLYRKRDGLKNIHNKQVNTVDIVNSANHSIKKQLMDVLTIPDRYNGWFLFAISNGIRIILKEKPNVIFSTSPPATSHIIALFLKMVFGIPWVADFRDPWVSIMADTNKFKYRVNSCIEREVINKANIVIANTHSLRECFIKSYKFSNPESKFTVLTNGYDSSDFQSFENATDSKEMEFVISHTGEFYDDIRTPDNFMIAISQLINENFITPDKIKINLVGGGDYTKTTKFDEFLKGLGLTETINVIDFVPHRQSVEYLYNSTVLLLLQTSSMANFQIPAKAFEYIGIGKPILTVAPTDGATADLIRKTGTGIIAQPNNLESIKNAILRFYQEYKQDDLKKYRNEQAMQDYNRKDLTRVLSELLDDVVS